MGIPHRRAGGTFCTWDDCALEEEVLRDELERNPDSKVVEMNEPNDDWED